MPIFQESLFGCSEQEYVTTVQAFSNQYNAASCLLPFNSPEMTADFVWKAVTYVSLYNSVCAEKVPGIRSSLDCIRICFRHYTGMEAVESEAFVSALLDILEAAFNTDGIDATTAADLVDTGVRCLCTASFQNSAVEAIVHSKATHNVLISILRKSIPVYLAASCAKFLYLLSSQNTETALGIVSDEGLSVMCVTSEYCMYHIIGNKSSKAEEAAIDMLVWMFKLFYVADSVTSDRTDPVYDGYRFRICSLCRSVFCLRDGVALKDERLFTLQNHAIQVLTLCPAQILPAVLLGFNEKNSNASSEGIGAHIMAISDYLLRVLSIQFWREETTKLTLTAHNAIEKYPILILMTHLAQADDIIRQHWKVVLLEAAVDKENNTTGISALGAKIVALMISPNSMLKRYSSEFLYCLCSNNPDEFTRRLGIGNTIWFLKIRELV